MSIERDHRSREQQDSVRERFERLEFSDSFRCRERHEGHGLCGSFGSRESRSYGRSSYGSPEEVLGQLEAYYQELITQRTQAGDTVTANRAQKLLAKLTQDWDKKWRTMERASGPVGRQKAENELEKFIQTALRTFESEARRNGDLTGPRPRGRDISKDAMELLADASAARDDRIAQAQYGQVPPYAVQPQPGVINPAAYQGYPQGYPQQVPPQGYMPAGYDANAGYAGMQPGVPPGYTPQPGYYPQGFYPQQPGGFGQFISNFGNVASSAINAFGNIANQFKGGNNWLSRVAGYFSKKPGGGSSTGGGSVYV